jgi:hypothetical protein
MQTMIGFTLIAQVPLIIRDRWRSSQADTQSNWGKRFKDVSLP